MSTNSEKPADSEARGVGLWAHWLRWLERYRPLPYVLPFVVFMLTGLIEPDAPATEPPTHGEAARVVADESRESSVQAANGVAVGYPWAYVIRIVATLASIVAVFPVYRAVPLRISFLAVVVGIVGGFVWIFICRAGWGPRLFTALGVAQWMTLGARPAFDPLAAFSDSTVTLIAFLAVRFVGLAAVVPLIEEFFLRGFLMRFFTQAEWWTIPLGSLTAGSAALATVYGVLAHPAEPIAAAVWFTIITLLYARTRNLWDCVLAHAITNAMLGAYVLVWKHWTLW